MKNINKANNSLLKVIPLALILLIVPMIVYFKNVSVPNVAADFYQSESVADFFSYYKVLWLLVFTICSVMFFSIYTYIKKLKIKLNVMFVPLFIYYILVFLSASFSKYHEVAFNGFIDRYEGFWVISCYVVICCIATYIVTCEKDIKLLFGALILCTCIICILGASQFFNFDFLQTDFIKKLMLPSEFESISDSLEFKFPKSYVYSTLFNPNYVGSFCAMVLPISVVMFAFVKKIYLKLLSGALCGLLLLNLIGSRSSAGYIGAFVSILFLIILLRKKLLKYWVPIAIIVVLCTGVIAYLNYNNPGFILNELSNFLPKKQATIVYKDGQYKDLTNITISGNKMSIYMGNTPVNISYDSSKKTVHFTDDTGKAINAVPSPDDKTLYSFEGLKYWGLTLKATQSLFEITAINTKFYVQLNQAGEFKFLNGAGRPIDIINPPSFGFEGYERWASSRGYIWSRSIPILKDTIFLGRGPDNFVFAFPQNDIQGKLKAFNIPTMLVDKPHSMYLQIAINTGVISLVAFLIFVFWYIGSSFKMYFKPKKSDSFYYMAGSACVLSVIGFLVAGLANDSNVNISPIFWIILGIGFACNRLYAKELVSTNDSPGKDIHSKMPKKIVTTRSFGK